MPHASGVYIVGCILPAQGDEQQPDIEEQIDETHLAEMRQYRRPTDRFAFHERCPPALTLSARTHSLTHWPSTAAGLHGRGSLLRASMPIHMYSQGARECDRRAL